MVVVPVKKREDRTKGRTDDRHSENASHLFLRLVDDSLSIPCIDNEIFIVRVPK